MEVLQSKWSAFFGFVSLRTKLITAFIFCILLPIAVLGVYVYKSFEKEMSSQIANVTSDRLQQVNRNIERRLNELTNVSRSIVLDEQLREMLQHPPKTDREKLQFSHFMDKKYLEVSTSVVSDSIYLTLYDTQGNLYTNWNSFVSTRNDITQAPWYIKTLNNNGFMVWNLQHDSFVNPSGPKLMTVSMLVKADNLIDNLGILAISEPVTPYLDILNPDLAYPLSLGFIVDSNGGILGDDPERAREVYQAVKPLIDLNGDTFNTRIGQNMYIVGSYLIPMTGWRVVQVVPYSEMLKSVIKNRDIAIVILIVCLALFVGLIILLTSMITKPLSELRLVMKKVESGALDVVYSIETRDEIGFLGKSFNSMLTDLRTRMQNEIILEKRKEQAKLEALQAQITPHFLYNTMNTIKWMSIMTGNKQITEMLMALGHLLNTSIHRGQEEIPLREELENVRYFLTIQKYRFGDTVKVNYEIDERCLDALVPKLSLQPLVENVYQHGLFMENSGLMHIRSLRKENDLYLIVEDTGKGLTDERLKEIRYQMEKEQMGPSIGLANVNKRIKLMYESPYGLSMERDEEDGLTRVTIVLPYREGEGDHNEN
ncbi:MAG: multi-sensor signal transduction histidine kinase [Paenibacillus sp.]|jgi:sensor histidine kinase YesM|nr:multi-sensor signal transduction histidine kinase [Paenibacillus sp.]